MKFTQIYRETIVLWPDEISIKNAKGINNFPELNVAWDKAEDEGEDRSLSEWHTLMILAILGGFHSLAIKSYRQGAGSILKADVDLVEVEKIFSENLFNIEANYSESMKTVYENDLKP